MPIGTKDYAIQQLRSHYIDANALREQFPSLATSLLKGEFDLNKLIATEQENGYEARVILDQDLGEHNPQIIRLARKTSDIALKELELLICLAGNFSLNVHGGIISKLGQLGSYLAQRESILRIQNQNPETYALLVPKPALSFRTD
jgi:hypothetical protein